MQTGHVRAPSIHVSSRLLLVSSNFLSLLRLLSLLCMCLYAPPEEQHFVNHGSGQFLACVVDDTSLCTSVMHVLIPCMLKVYMPELASILSHMNLHCEGILPVVSCIIHTASLMCRCSYAPPEEQHFVNHCSGQCLARVVDGTPLCSSVMQDLIPCTEGGLHA